MNAALRDFFDSYYRLRPVNATFTGVHDHDDKLPDWSPDALARAVDEMRTVRAALVGTRDDAPLTDAGARDRELAIAFLDLQIAEHEGSHFHRRNPSLAVGEAAFGLISLMTRPFAAADCRADRAAARLAAMPAFLAGARAACAAPVPAEWRVKALRECDGLDRLLEDGIETWIAVEGIGSAAADRLRRQTGAASAAVADHRRWLVDVPASAEHCYGAGADLFELLIRRGHWCDRPAGELAREAWNALEEALAALHARTASVGGWSGVQSRLEDAHPTVDDYLATYDRIWHACRRASDQHDLVTWPDYPIRYVSIPAQTRTAAPFLYYPFYRSPAPFDDLPVHDCVVTPVEPQMAPAEQRRRLRACNTSVITLNHVIHHGAIGHHVQNYYAYHGDSDIGRVAAVDCASRIGMFPGGTMAEGWACYATDLMDEIGFLTADQSLAQQHTRARLAARAVADIGLHTGSLTFAQTVALYRDRVGMTPEAARAEACKNSMFPGTAIMYWLGTDGLHRLRRDRAAGLPLRTFHNRLLSFGSIPVPLIARVWS